MNKQKKLMTKVKNDVSYIIGEKWSHSPKNTDHSIGTKQKRGGATPLFITTYTSVGK
jgi:hypothetical protein